MEIIRIFFVDCFDLDGYLTPYLFTFGGHFYLLIGSDNEIKIKFKNNICFRNNQNRQDSYYPKLFNFFSYIGFLPGVND